MEQQAMVLEGPGRGGVVRIPEEAGLQEIMAVEACGICHSDRKAFATPPTGMSLPRILGHEIVGRLARDLPTQGLFAGDRIVVWPAFCCGTCHYCLSGRENLCPEVKVFGYHLNGGFTDRLYVRPTDLARLQGVTIPESLMVEQAVFCEPLACVLNGLRQLRPIRPSRCLILGAGVMGRLTARLLRSRWQPEIFFHDPQESRLRLAAAEGERCRTNLQADLVFVATSDSAAFDLGLKHLGPGGTMLLFSGLTGKKTFVLPHNEIHQRQQALVGAYGCTPADFDMAVQLLAQGEVRGDDLMTRRLKLDDLPAELNRGPVTSEFKAMVVF